MTLSHIIHRCNLSDLQEGLITARGLGCSTAAMDSAKEPVTSVMGVTTVMMDRTKTVVRYYNPVSGF